MKILILGDSHTQALSSALRKRGARAVGAEFAVYQFLRVKNDVSVGDVDLPGAVELVRGLGAADIVVSAIGGNQHNVLGLVQHPEAFDVFETGDASGQGGAGLIPRQALLDLFESRIRPKDEPRLREIRQAARGRVYHLAPPPPKRDEAHILRRPEAAFAALLQQGISPAGLRLKMWKLQLEAVRSLSRQCDVGVLLPPRQVFGADGFLKPEYYADDATHANRAYGELILQSLERFALGPAAPGNLDQELA